MKVTKFDEFVRVDGINIVLWSNCIKRDCS